MSILHQNEIRVLPLTQSMCRDWHTQLLDLRRFPGGYSFFKD